MLKTKSFRKAEAWDREQYLEMSPEQRVRIAHALRRKAYPGKAKDVRACHPRK